VVLLLYSLKKIVLMKDVSNIQQLLELRGEPMPTLVAKGTICAAILLGRPRAGLDVVQHTRKDFANHFW